MPMRRSVVLFLVAALALRLAFVRWLTVPAPQIYADAMWYHAAAEQLAAGLGYIHHLTRQPTAAWPPGYPAILAAVYRVFGSDPSRAYLLNVVAGTATCWVAGRIAVAVSRPAAAAVTVALVALFPSQLLFCSLVMSETVFTLLLCILVLAAILLVQNSGARLDGRALRGWIVWGIGVGLASLVRAEAVVLLLVPPLVLVTTSNVKHGEATSTIDPRTAASRAGAALALFLLTAIGAATAELPWLVRNALLFGRFVPVSTSFGRTLLIGHNPVAEGDMNLYSPDPAADHRDLVSGGAAGELAVDQRREAAALQYIREHPGREIVLEGKRLFLMYRADRVWGEWYRPAPGSPATPSVVDALGRASNIFYWAVLLLAVPAAVRMLRDRDGPELVLIVTLLVWTAFFVIVLYGSERFHFPLVPLLCVLAADTIVTTTRRFGLHQ
ncbi:MAG TPA: glycosyltransferase family 39 protein [Candidatus Binatia bacterium]